MVAAGTWRLGVRRMNEHDKQFALRMIPYGVFVVTSVDPKSLAAAASTVHWVSQACFRPCLIMVSLQSGHPVLELARFSGRFAINMLGKDDAAEAVTFKRPIAMAMTGSLDLGTAEMGGYGLMWGRRRTILLQRAVAVLECAVKGVVEGGDHCPVIAEVIDAHVRLPQDGRPDEMILHQRELGKRTFYGG